MEHLPEDLTKRLDALRTATLGLEPDAARRDAWNAAALAHAERWLESLPALPGYVPDDARAEAAFELPEEGPSTIENTLSVLADAVDRVGVNESSPNFFGFIPGSGIYAGALGDYLAAVSNRYAGVTYAGPGAVRLEQRLVRWFADEIGYPAEAAGDLTSGGSIGNLSAVVAAREAYGIRAKEIERTVVYVSRQTHHSVTKALRIAGLGECVLRLVPLDASYRMRPDALAGLAGEDRAQGLRPWLVVASAGATDTGAVDPLAALADVTESEGLWLHVDAAYGGAFALCEPGRRILRGVERSNSLVVDPHKGFFLPFGSGLVLARDGAPLHRAHTYSASYMQDADRFAAGAISPSELSPELTRPFRGLRLWLALRLAGVAAFRAALEEKLLLARYFHQRLSQHPDFEVGPAPDLSVVTFRLRAPADRADEMNAALALAIQQDGRIYLSSTQLEQRFTLRLAILNARTHRAHVDRALEVIVELAGKLAQRSVPSSV